MENTMASVEEYTRLFVVALEFNISRLPPPVRKVAETYLEAVRLTLSSYVIPAWNYMTAIDIGEDAKMSIAIGLAVGIGTVVLLVMFPGQPRDDYDPVERASKKKEGQKNEHEKEVKTEEKGVKTT